jgi:hypothetical protein
VNGSEVDVGRLRAISVKPSRNGVITTELEVGWVRGSEKEGDGV